MCALTKCEEIEQLCYVVSTISHCKQVMLMAARYVGGSSIPNAMVGALFTKASSNGRAFLLDYGSFVGDCFGSTHIADKLFDYCSIIS